MRFIVDAQLPYRLKNVITNLGFDCIHTSDLEFGNAIDDKQIIKISLEQQRIVISKDADFYNRYFLVLEPYKLLIVSTGNISNNKLVEVFKNNWDKITDALVVDSIVEITNRSIITID